MKLYWDSCVLLAYLKGEAERLSKIEPILDDAHDGKIEIVTSTISITEVAYVKDAALPASDAELDKKIEEFWHSVPVRLVEFFDLIAQDAAQLVRNANRRSFRLRPMDAIHLATAQRMGVDEFNTYEAPAKRKKWAGLTGLLVQEPDPRQPQLPMIPDANGPAQPPAQPLISPQP
jgi:predicted nucleic acid-binding protein